MSAVSSFPSARLHLRRLLASRALWGILAAAILAAAFFGWLDAAGGPQGLRQRYGWAAGAILVLGQAVAGIWPVPASEVLALANSVLHGFWLGALLNWTGWMLAALLQYSLVRRAALDFDFERGLGLLPAWLRRFPAGHPAFLIVGRLMPAGPQLVNCAAAALGVPLWRHTWCAAIGNVPGAFLISGVANGLLAA